MTRWLMHHRRMRAGALPSPIAPRDTNAEPSDLRVARALLILLAWTLPFEMPLFRVGPLQITTVELSLYAMLAAWGLAVAGGIFRGGRTVVQGALAAMRRDSLGRAAVVWGAVLFASTACAPTDRTAALKFVLRSSSGILAFFACRTLARPAVIGRRVLVALLAGALVSAVTAWLDAWVPATEPAWKLFREGQFDTFGLPRASGVFAYPTMGAMYWEAAVPLLVVAPFLGDWSRGNLGGRRSVLLAVLGGTVLVEALLASATRSGLAGAAVVCAVLAGLVWRLGASVRRAAVGVLSVIAGLSMVTLAATNSGSLLGLRLHWWRDAHWFGVEYVADTTPRAIHVEEHFQVPVTLRNTGTITWHRAGPRPTYLSYHWQPIGRPITNADFEGQRTELPADVPPGAKVQLLADASGPTTEGSYRLEWDVVQEHVTWFSERGNPMAEEAFDVAPPVDGAEVWTGDQSAPVFDTPAPSRIALWRAAIVLWRQRPVLGIGPDNFRRRYEAVIPPAPAGMPYTDTRIHANSLYLETLADLGIGGILSLAFLVWSWIGTIRRHHAAGRLAGLGSGVAVGAFFVHGALDYFFEFTPLFGLFWVLLGLTAACEPEPPPS
ncbi:MAG: O-antigen ligase family protein [Polyangiaceae bacterium]